MRRITFVVALFSSSVAFAQGSLELPRPTRALVLDSVGRGGRTAVFSDALLGVLARGNAVTAHVGDTLFGSDGVTHSWRASTVDADGSIAEGAPVGGWVFIEFERERDEVVLLEPSGFSYVVSDGAPRAGDVYQLGYLRTPIALHAGHNEVLGKVSRGRPRLVWSAAPAPLFIEERDRTVPDLLRGGGMLDATRYSPNLGLVVTNATLVRRVGLRMRATVEGAPTCVTALPEFEPLESRKCRVAFTPPSELTRDALRVSLELLDARDTVLHSDAFELAVREPNQTHKRTFVSAVDGSVQYYAVVPPPQVRAGCALILSLHGASVEATSQAAAYAPKDWAYVIAPTNRRPYGFDWEDWGRLDALEVLADAQRVFATDPQRTYLTGHSMGGHGTWNVGVQHADLFAAIAPSAGWSDFWSYMGVDAAVPSDPLEAVLHRACNVSRTTLLERNLEGRGVYVLHGDADDNVPVSEARKMREALAKFHADFAYYERPGAGHWWGNECVDWAPLIEFLKARVSAPSTEQRIVDFRSVDLGVRSRSAWVEIQAQRVWLAPSHVRAECDVAKRRVAVTTENVADVQFSMTNTDWSAAEPVTTEAVAGLGTEGELEIALDGQELGRHALGGDLWFRRAADGAWAAADEIDARHKNPLRCGGFKAAFRRSFVLVYGTHGSVEENAWALAKARFDAETFRYRGNASPRVLRDDDLLAGKLGRATEECNFVLYGHREMNAAWTALVATDAFDVARGSVRVGARRVEGADLCALAVVPGHDAAQSIGIVAGTGLAGLRSTNHFPYFVSGAGFPDWIVGRTELLERGAAGFVGAGFFAGDWSADGQADSAWR